MTRWPARRSSDIPTVPTKPAPPVTTIFKSHLPLLPVELKIVSGGVAARSGACLGAEMDDGGGMARRDGELHAHPLPLLSSRRNLNWNSAEITHGKNRLCSSRGDNPRVQSVLPGSQAGNKLLGSAVAACDQQAAQPRMGAAIIEARAARENPGIVFRRVDAVPLFSLETGIEDQILGYHCVLHGDVVKRRSNSFGEQPGPCCSPKEFERRLTT